MVVRPARCTVQSLGRVVKQVRKPKGFWSQLVAPKHHHTEAVTPNSHCTFDTSVQLQFRSTQECNQGRCSRRKGSGDDAPTSHPVNLVVGAHAQQEG